MKRLRIGVLASGRGANLQALLDACEANLLPAEVAVVLSHRREAYALERARQHHVPAIFLARSHYASPEEYDHALRACLEEHQVDLVILTGYMLPLTSEFVRHYPHRILSVHPTLEPLPGEARRYGLHLQEEVLARGYKVAGCTVQFVAEGPAWGPIVLQRAVPVEEDDAPETLAARLLPQEQELLVEAIGLYAAGRLEIQGPRVRILTPEEAERRKPKVRQVQRALISVSDKTGLVEFAQGLQALGVEILSTGGTARLLREAGLAVREVSDYTGFPEILDGRVKTLHPKIHGGILALRENEAHARQLAEQGIEFIDLVVVNLYPFEETIARPQVTLEEALENIDIGGPTLLRAAAKNYRDVLVVCNPHHYDEVLEELRSQGGLVSEQLRARLALDVFRHTAHYDALIADYLEKQFEMEERPFPRLVNLRLEKVQNLRYGENPHQAACFYREPGRERNGIVGALQLQGRELSYNNLLDTDAAWELVLEFSEPTVALIKHNNPCGVASAETLVQAYQEALACDPVSAFGSVVALNRSVDEATAQEMADLFIEVIIAPGFEEEALKILQRKENLRLLTMEHATRLEGTGWEIRRVGNGFLVQERDRQALAPEDWRVVTQRTPTAEELAALQFGWKVVKHVRSNAIVLVQGRKTVGIGAGQMSRVDAARLAVTKAGDRVPGSVMASDAFFPFRDSIDEAAAAGVRAIVEPGGSVRDQECIDAANEHGMAMVFTGIRHFRH